MAKQQRWTLGGTDDLTDEQSRSDAPNFTQPQQATSLEQRYSPTAAASKPTTTQTQRSSFAASAAKPLDLAPKKPQQAATLSSLADRYNAVAATGAQQHAAQQPKPLAQSPGRNRMDDERAPLTDEQIVMAGAVPPGMPSVINRGAVQQRAAGNEAAHEARLAAADAIARRNESIGAPQIGPTGYVGFDRFMGANAGTAARQATELADRFKQRQAAAAGSLNRDLQGFLGDVGEKTGGTEYRGPTAFDASGETDALYAGLDKEAAQLAGRTPEGVEALLDEGAGDSNWLDALMVQQSGGGDLSELGKRYTSDKTTAESEASKKAKDAVTRAKESAAKAMAAEGQAPMDPVANNGVFVDERLEAEKQALIAGGENPATAYSLVRNKYFDENGVPRENPDGSVGTTARAEG